MDGMIYFIKSSTGLIKIGTTANVAARLAALRTASPASLSLIGVMDGGAKTEHALHVRFAECRDRGEWFRPDPPLLGFIGEHARAVDSVSLILERTPLSRGDAEVDQALVDLGARIRRARLRRNITSEQMSERTDMSRPTYRGIEQGAPGTAVGKLVSVLRELGMLASMDIIAETDEIGHRLQDAELMQRQRVHSRPTSKAPKPRLSAA